MKSEAVIKKTTSTLGKFGSATAGVVVGSVVASKIPSLDFLSKIPGVGPFLAKLAPGALVMLLAYLASEKFKNDYVENGSIGVGLAGFVDVLRRTGILEKINKMIPGSGLSGVGGGMRGLGLVQNYGAYSPDYFLKSNWATRPLNGVGSPDAKSFSLQGSDKQSFSLQGPGETKAFGLQGLGCMYQ